MSSDSLVLVACSGGADSLALAAATAFVAPRMRLRAGLVTVDHGLQAGSEDRARDLAGWAAETGLTPAIVKRVDATPRGDGPEAAARAARYTALAEAAIELDAAAVLLAHTRDDQAETVLLALARGAGPRGLSGMPARRVIDGVTFVRPLLDVGRQQTLDACADMGLKPWSDPHNEDARYARSRVRQALPLLAATLGDDVIANLARTAGLIAADNQVLDEIASRELVAATDEDGALMVPELERMPDALRMRVLRLYALNSGATPAALSYRHITALRTLITDWHGQGPIALPGGVQVARQGKRMLTPRDTL
jgi:tRNA(Ile)-lysidine synthase